MKDLADLVARFEGRRVVVLGDLAVDCAVETRPDRLSHEAPVMVLRYEGRRYSAGCAANTVMNLHRLGARVVPIGIVGEDEPGRALVQEFHRAGIPDTGLVYSGTSVVKVRLLAGAPANPRHQIVRIDIDPQGPCPEDAMLELIARAGAAEGAEAVVVSDYGYGAASPGLLRAVRDAAPDALVSVDSRARVGEFEDVHLLTPNVWKAGDYLAAPLDTDEQVTRAARLLRERTGAEAVMLTRGDRGMVLAESSVELIPAHGPAAVVDPTGAGDMVIAAATLARIAGASWRQAASLAGFAAGMAVMRRGALGVDAVELSEALLRG